MSDDDKLFGEKRMRVLNILLEIIEQEEIFEVR